jgi:TPR repeat protein
MMHHPQNIMPSAFCLANGRGVLKDEVEAARYYNRLPIRMMLTLNMVMRSALRRDAAL